MLGYCFLRICPFPTNYCLSLILISRGRSSCLVRRASKEYTPQGRTRKARWWITSATICGTLDQQKISPHNCVCDIIQGTSLTSHIKSSKMFADYVFNLKNPLMQSLVLTRLVVEQIPIVLVTTLREYTLYALSMDDNAWMQGTNCTHKVSVLPKISKYDN